MLTEAQVQALEAVKEEKKAHGGIETHHPGFVVGQERLYVSYIRGAGKIDQENGVGKLSEVEF